MVPVGPGRVAAGRDKVVEAHRILMDLSEENRARFKDLMAVLEHK